MTKRIFLAGLAGGIAMFIWESIAHLVLPLGTAGIQTMPAEQAVLAAMHSSLGDASGFYFFPAAGQGSDAMRQYEQKLATSPSGILIYHPPGAKAMEPRQLIAEFLTELIESLLAVFLLAQTRLGSFGARVGFVVIAGVIGSLMTNIPYWNWYGYPAAYTSVYMATQVAGFLCVGLVAGAIVKPRASSQAA